MTKTKQNRHESELTDFRIAIEAKKQYMGKTTIPKALKKANPTYRTAHFGKWHNESIKPTDAGYDVTDGPNGNGPGDFADDGKTPLPEEDPKRIFSLTQKSIQFRVWDLYYNI